MLYQYAVWSPVADYDTFGGALLTVWKMCIGLNYDLTTLYTTGKWMQIGIIFFSVYIFITQIVLLNMLIAFMIDIYQKVSKTQVARFLQSRARLIVEVRLCCFSHLS